MDRKTCPLIDRECMGRECAWAVRHNSVNVTYWCCGAIANEPVIASMDRRYCEREEI